MQLEHLLDLLMQSPVHRRWTLERMVEVFTPPLCLGQFRAWINHGVLTGLATWALMSDEHSVSYIASGNIKREFWNSGQNLWFVDVIAPYGGALQLARELEEHFVARGFTSARSLRSRDKGRVHNWINTRHAQEIAA